MLGAYASSQLQLQTLMLLAWCSHETLHTGQSLLPFKHSVITWLSASRSVQTLKMQVCMLQKYCQQIFITKFLQNACSHATKILPTIIHYKILAKPVPFFTHSLTKSLSMKMPKHKHYQLLFAINSLYNSNLLPQIFMLDQTFSIVHEGISYPSNWSPIWPFFRDKFVGHWCKLYILPWWTSLSCYIKWSHRTNICAALKR